MDENKHSFDLQKRDKNRVQENMPNVHNQLVGTHSGSKRYPRYHPVPSEASETNPHFYSALHTYLS